MQYYNEKQIFGTDDEKMAKGIKGQKEWGMLVGHTVTADACTQCRQCEEACTQHLNITDRLAEIADWEGVTAAK